MARNLSGKEVFSKTVYAEARGEAAEGQIAVALVIKKRAALNLPHFGGSDIKDVCFKDYQFECWRKDGNGEIMDIEIHEGDVYHRIKGFTDEIYDGKHYDDPTDGADHYNNPDKEGYPEWTKNVKRTAKIGNHQFYRQY